MVYLKSFKLPDENYEYSMIMNKYNAYYECGKLEKCLSQYYTEEEIKTIQSYVEEHGSKLLKRKK